MIANPTLTSGGETIDASTIDKELIRSLQEIDEVEANVAIGYHAIEFLLWGQDLNGTGPGAGERPWTDLVARAVHGRQLRPAPRLSEMATDLLVDDLEDMVGDAGRTAARRARRVTAPAAAASRRS